MYAFFLAPSVFRPQSISSSQNKEGNNSVCLVKGSAEMGPFSCTFLLQKHFIKWDKTCSNSLERDGALHRHGELRTHAQEEAGPGGGQTLPSFLPGVLLGFPRGLLFPSASHLPALYLKSTRTSTLLQPPGISIPNSWQRFSLALELRYPAPV